MDNYYQQHQGYGYGNGIPEPARSGNTRSRGPTVDEALPFTPFGSITPFDPSIFPIPQAVPKPSATAFKSTKGVTNARNVLETLSAGATSAEQASDRCRKTLQDVQRLLDPENLTKYKFRTSPRRFHTDNIDAPAAPQRTPLTPFAKMVFDGEKAGARYLTPESPGTTTKKKPQPQSHTNGARVVIPTPQTQTKQEYDDNIYDTIVVNSQSSQRPAVVIQSNLTPAQRAEYCYISEKEAFAGAPAETPSKAKHATNGHRVISVDQRLKGDAAVNNLQSFIFEIFEAEDNQQPDTSGLVAKDGSAFFSHHEIEGSDVLILQSDVLTKLETLIQKVGANRRIDDIEIEHLTRIQRLCETTATASQSSKLHIGDDWDDDAAEEWQHVVTQAETSLVAARVLLRTMGAGAHLKELQSEDFLKIVLSVLQVVTETGIVAIVEERSSQRSKKDEAPADGKFAVALKYRKTLHTLLSTVTKTFRVLGDFLTKSDVEDTTITSVEYLCKLVIFAENASSEKDSVLGIQNFETMRRCAMDTLAKIFAKYADQRQFIFDEILISLEKLPATKQSSRQYRELVEAKPIQLVSALLMRLVQTSATYSVKRPKAGKAAEDNAEDSDNSEESEESSDEEVSDDEGIRVAPKRKKVKSAPNDLSSIAKPLHDSAESNASYVVRFLIQRAVGSSKSADEPYRRLLDIFTEDFLNVLGSSDWPAAELLLLTLVKHMVAMVKNKKNTAASRYMAIELLGTMGSGILDLQTSARSLAKTMEPGEAAIADRLTNSIQLLEAGSEVNVGSLVSFEGPYRMVVEYLQARTQGSNTAQLQSAYGFHLMQWATYVISAREGSTDSSISDSGESSKELSSKLRNMIIDTQWLEANHEYPNISTEQGRLAAMIVTLSSTFCKAFNTIFGILLSEMDSEQPTVRSRSLKSVAAILDTDPSILDRNKSVLNRISICANDKSSLVRSSAISLFDKCTTLRQSLDPTVYERVIKIIDDESVVVKKAAMSLLKKIYLRNESPAMRSNIACGILSLMGDKDETVVESARQIMEEVWFTPLHGLKSDGDRAIEAKVRYGAQTALLVQTVELGEEVLKVLESLLKDLLIRSKMAKANSGVCQNLILTLFDGIIDSAQIPGSPNQDSILSCLAIFAKTCPRLFVPTQLELLDPFTQNLTKDDNLDAYRSVVTILRHTMPEQTMLKPEFMKSLQTNLMTIVPRLPKTELAEVVSCLWTLNGMLHNTERIVNFLISVLNGIYGMKSIDFNTADPRMSTKVSKLMVIAGQFCKTCELDDHVSAFKAKLPWYKGDSVTALAVEALSPFMSPKQPLPVREAAIEAVCAIAQNWPKLYMRTDVVNAFETVFKDHETSLEETLLAGLEGFFCPEDEVDDGEDIPELGSGVATGTERLVRTYVATDRDGASIAIAQRFLPQIMNIALSSCNEAGFIAAKLVISINKQSFVLPKQSAPALVALETCPNAKIANMAFKEHRDQHMKRESLFEKEYMRAVQKVFEYQRDVVGSAVGYTGQPPVSKMHLLWAVLKGGKAQVRKKFLANYAQKLDFNLSTLDTASTAPTHMLFVRFCVENLAFFEYEKTDELLHLLTSLEKSFSGTGTSVAQVIENDVLRLRVDTLPGANDDPLALPPPQPTIDPARLRQLAVPAQILSMIWETRSFLIRLWGLQKQMIKAKQAPKSAAKEIIKAPHRVSNAATVTEAYLKRIIDIANALASPDSQLAICHSFVEMISVDTEVKVGSENEEEIALENGYETPSETASGKSPSLPPSGGKAKRKKSIDSNAGTPRKKQRPSYGDDGGDSDDDADGDWE